MTRLLTRLALCAAILGMAASASAQITADARSTGGQTLAASVTGATSVSWSHTLGTLTNGILIVSCAHDAGANATGVNWDDGATNQALTLKGSATQGSTRAEIWYKLSPSPTGTKTVRVTWSGSHEGQGGSASYSGVGGFNAASPQTATGASGTNPSLSVTTTTGELVIDSAVQDLAVGGDTPTKGASQTYIAAGLNTNTVTIESGHSERAGSGSSVSMTWTMKAAGGAWAQVGVSLAPPATVALTGTVTSTATEADIVAGGKTIILTVSGDTLVPASSGAITYVGGQVNGFAGTTSAQTITFALTGGLASTPAAGDLVIITYAIGSTADRSLAIRNTGATDYTLIGSELYQNDTFDANQRTAYRFMPGTPETQFVLTETVGGGTGSTADAGRYTVHVFRGVDTSTPLDVAAVSGGAIDGSGVDAGAITPTTAGAFVYVAGAAASTTGSTMTSSDLTDFRAGSTVDTNDISIGAGYFAWTSGSFNPAAFGNVPAGTTANSWTSMTVALRPLITTPFNDARAAIRDGCDSAQAEGSGWDALRSTTMPVGNVVRTSDTVATITLAAAGTYNITAQETVTCTMPSAALTNGVAAVATPTFTVDTSGGGAPPCVQRLSMMGVSSCGQPAAMSSRRRNRH